MVMDLLHASDSLRADDGGLSRSVVGDDAAQMNNAVADDDSSELLLADKQGSVG